MYKLTAAIRKDIISQFTKSELLKLAKEVGLTTTKDARSSELAKAIVDYVVANMADIESQCSDLMSEFMLTAEIIDEEGNVIAGLDASDDLEAIEKPDCFGFADRRDPACLRCRLIDLCEKTRIQNRPPCFGKYFEETHELCRACLEASFCKVAMIG